MKPNNPIDNKPYSYLDMHRVCMEKKYYPNLKYENIKKSQKSKVKNILIKNSFQDKSVTKKRKNRKETAFKQTPDISSVQFDYSTNRDATNRDAFSQNVIETRIIDNYNFTPSPNRGSSHDSEENYNTLKAKYYNNYVEGNVQEETINSAEVNCLNYDRDDLVQIDDKDVTLNKIDTIKKNKTKRSKYSVNSHIMNSNTKGGESSYFDKQKAIRNQNESQESTQRSINSDLEIEIMETQKLIENLNGFFGTTPFYP